MPASKYHPYKGKGGHAARCAVCVTCTPTGHAGWVEIHVEGEAAFYRSGCRHTAIGQVTAQMVDVITACKNLKPSQVPLAHRTCAEAAAAAHAVLCKRDDKHWDDECLTLLCSFAPDSVKQLCTLGKKLSVKMLNEYCKAVGLYVPANTLRADLRYMVCAIWLTGPPHPRMSSSAFKNGCANAAELSMLAAETVSIAHTVKPVPLKHGPQQPALQLDQAMAKPLQGLGCEGQPETSPASCEGRAAAAADTEVRPHRFSVLRNTAAVPTPAADPPPGPHALGPAAMVQAPSQQVMQTLASVQELVRSNGAARPYKSCLVQQQLVLKLVNQEPGSLGNDVVGSVQQLVADPGSAWLAARISVRRGCTLVTLDLVACCPAADLADTALGPTALTAPLPQDSETLQVWLDKLLAPGTQHKAGDTVHLQVGSCWMQATFSGSPPSWQLTALPPSPLNLAITAASQRVWRLPGPAAAVSSLGSAAEPGSVSLSLSLSHSCALDFRGSDATSIQDDQEVVQVAARGCWGAGLPVVVLDVTSTHCSESHLFTSTLQLALPLSLAPSPGSLFLELWHGPMRLASLPLLLLPASSPCTPGSDAADSPPGHCPSPDLDLDLELVELEGAVACLAEGEGQKEGLAPDGGQTAGPVSAGCPEPPQEPSSLPEPGQGLNALLADLGHLLHLAWHASSPPALDAALAALGSSSSGPAAAPDWGGVVAGVAHMARTNTLLADSTLVMAQGLMDWLTECGLQHTAGMVARAMAVVAAARAGRQEGQAGQAKAQVQVMGDPVVAVGGNQQQQIDDQVSENEVHCKQRQTQLVAMQEEQQGEQEAAGAGPSLLTLPSSAKALPSPSLSSPLSASCADLTAIKRARPSLVPAHQASPQHLAAHPSNRPLLPALLRCSLLGFPPPQEQAYSIWLSRRSAPMAQLWSATFLAIILSCALRSAQEGVLVREIPTHLTLALPYILSGLLAAQGYFRAYEPSQVLHALVRAGVLMSGCLGFTVFPSSYSNGYMAHIDTWAEVLLHTPAEHVRVPILVLNRALLTCSAWCMTRYHFPDMGLLTLAYRLLTPLLGSLALGTLLDCHRRHRYLTSINTSTEPHDSQPAGNRAASESKMR
ncbi:hypothetical protein QJQ45_029025 [Haematococcus lacustris]|nr:hypothetical protein QJQ45_029025 [Haematococcus lacustris]